jgi:hypothetical protein
MITRIIEVMLIVALLAFSPLSSSAIGADDVEHPNVIVIMTDNQGYGD